MNITAIDGVASEIKELDKLSEATPSLKFKNVKLSLTTDRGVSNLLRGVSFEAKPGEVVAIVGESGSGKSTLLRTAVRLTPPGSVISGAVSYDSENVLSMTKAAVRSFRATQCRSVFQDPWAALHPLHSISRQLMESLRSAEPGISKTEGTAKCIAALRSVGISDPEARMHAYPHEMSGGQLQRVVIAMGLLSSAKILLCDEITSALDVTTQSTVLELIRELADTRGVIVLLATHDLPMLRGVADQIVVMYAGRVVEVGTAEQILNAPVHPYTAALLNSTPSLNGQNRLVPIEGTAPSPLENPTGCAFAARCALARQSCIEKVPELFEAGSSDSRHLAACFVTTNGVPDNNVGKELQERE